jgi:hypothetical protein
MVGVEKAHRIFRAGTLDIEDPNPGMGAMESWNHLRNNFPHLKGSVLSDPLIEGDKVIIKLDMPPPKTNG